MLRSSKKYILNAEWLGKAPEENNGPKWRGIDRDWRDRILTKE